MPASGLGSLCQMGSGPGFRIPASLLVANLSSNLSIILDATSCRRAASRRELQICAVIMRAAHDRPARASGRGTIDDHLGDSLPPDCITRVREDAFYGWDAVLPLI
jgi:hypothetical protein